jgi:antitoxin FitA
MLTLLSKPRGGEDDRDADDQGLDPETHARLRIEAARHGRSMEAEVRAILTERLAPDAAERGLGSRIHARFAGLEGELQLPDRGGEPPRAAVSGP